MLRCERGQATVEAAFALPLALLLVLLLVQPGILLYDRVVMQGAAAEACRLLATAPESGEVDCESYIRRRLGAVPQQENFHVHKGECSWDIKLEGGEGSRIVSASISTEARPLPLIGAGAELFGIVNERGNFEVKAAASMETQPEWAASAKEGFSPAAWIGAWLDEG